MVKLAELNAMDREHFVNTLAGIFEHSPWVAARTAGQRPFRTRADLHAALCHTVQTSAEDEKISLICAHPDLVGDATLTTESKKEQGAAGLGKLSGDEIARFQSFNAEYRQRFGFPFVICARLNKKDAILHAFPTRLQNSPDQEIETALDEIFKIAELRLKDVVE